MTSAALVITEPPPPPGPTLARVVDELTEQQLAVLRLEQIRGALDTVRALMQGAPEMCRELYQNDDGKLDDGLARLDKVVAESTLLAGWLRDDAAAPAIFQCHHCEWEFGPNEIYKVDEGYRKVHACEPCCKALDIDHSDENRVGDGS